MAAPKSVFQLTLRHRIWRVTLDGVFFGDYRSKQQAVDGVNDVRPAFAAAGRSVEIVVAANDGF